MKPEKEQLILDVLDPQSSAHRAATLAAGGRILRWRRRRRVAVQVFATVAFLAVIFLTMQQFIVREPPLLTAVPPPAVPPAESLTDAQLLDLFPDTPVGLVTLENGKQRLIFPRPGDEERFVKRL